MQKETEKQVYSTPSSELLELTQESVICTVSSEGTFNRGNYDFDEF